ncbi:copper chaperone PCu(A)C [Fodinibius halophilus]|uniref:Copper chaperone PCu(A)C n=1 Tax=Fodinibius halophilus TaxID=1736908 RepID=A0A6M1T364_9BACT|nr:copper chaperone PCu(A)C [Fodinibius halophilus]NGP87655.1 copper chaperone PCu(A)C [Fodinibius halophilus]
MRLPDPITFILLVSCVLFLGCSSESKSEKSTNEVILGKVELANGWARPAAKGQTSSIYLVITNGTASRDTLLGASSPISDVVELHQSIQHDDGTISMEQAGNQVIAAGEKLNLEPGGYHLMLKNINRELTVGDSLSVTLNFARVGSKTITVLTKTQQN